MVNPVHGHKDVCGSRAAEQVDNPGTDAGTVYDLVGVLGVSLRLHRYRDGLPPAHLRTPPPSRTYQRQVSVFRLGMQWLQRQVLRGRIWQRLWLTPEPWPSPPANITIVYGE